MRTLGLDIGGAHVKSALFEKGSATLPARRTDPYEIYKNPERLHGILMEIREKQEPDRVALTMTGELSDVFANRRVGVRWIINAVVNAMSPLDVRVVDVDGRLISRSRAAREWGRVASANWAATAAWTARHIDRCVIVDIGSTTVDILPIVDGAMAVKGKTDLGRLKSGELLYTGYLRTNAAFVRRAIDIDGAVVETSPELFAIMGDVHLLLGDITAKDYTTPTPDGGPKTKKGAAARLARIVLSEPGELGMSVVRSVAVQIKKTQVEKITRAVERIIGEHGFGDGTPIALMGPGRIYLEEIRGALGGNHVFVDEIGGVPIHRVDPAACAAALWE